MKFKPADFTRELDALFKDTLALLFYGPDRGLSFDNMTLVIDRMLPGGDDGFSLVDFSADDLKTDPGKLVDEAYAISFSPNRKIIRVKDAGNETAEAMTLLLKNPSPPPALILVLSGELAPGSPLRGLFEREEKLAALPSYLDDDTVLAQVIRRALTDAGINKIPSDVVNMLSMLLGENRTTTKSELEKLTLYLAGRDEITMDDVEKCVMDTSSMELGDLPIAIATGDTARLAAVLPRLFAQGIEAATLARVVGLHFKSLYFMREEFDAGKTMDEIFKIRRIFFKLEPAYERQIRLWSQDNILRAISHLSELEVSAKTTGVEAEPLASQIFFYLAAKAGKK